MSDVFEKAIIFWLRFFHHKTDLASVLFALVDYIISFRRDAILEETQLCLRLLSKTKFLIVGYGNGNFTTTNFHQLCAPRHSLPIHKYVIIECPMKT